MAKKKANDSEDIPLVSDINKIIHEPARLLLMSLLFVVKSSDFQFLKTQTKLTDGNLSSHISKLENAGYLKVDKKFKGKKPTTELSLTTEGRHAYTQYREEMDKIFTKFQSSK
jgi:DNA-binding transcriptional ArsR family regulator